jgi:drug/metabolite transporter (DMT)-like permease
MNKAIRADLLFVLLTVIWGGTFPLIRDAMSFIAPGEFVFFRFVLAGCILLPFVLRFLNKISWAMLLFGAVLGCLNYGTYVFQSAGLETISSARAAFITGTSAVIVPFLAPLAGLGKPTRLDLLSVLLCLLGLYVLTGADVTHFSVGDAWTFGCALSVAGNIVFVQWMTQRIHSALLMTFLQIMFTIPLTAFVINHESIHLLATPAVMTAILYCAILATIFTMLIQMRFQRDTTATKAAIIFTLEPVFASIFAWLFNDEGMSMNLVFGGILILMSIVANDAVGALVRKKSTS